MKKYGLKGWPPLMFEMFEREKKECAPQIATFIKSAVIKYNTWFFQFLLNNLGEKRRFAIHRATKRARHLPLIQPEPLIVSIPILFSIIIIKTLVTRVSMCFSSGGFPTYCSPRNVPLKKKKPERKTRAREKSAGYQINGINPKMFVTSIYSCSCYTIVFHSTVYYSFI